MLHPSAEVEALDTHGQSWRGETVEEGIALCGCQCIEPLFRKYLPRDGKILEAGCGIGRWVFYLQRLGYDITGIDIAADALRMAREYDPHAPIHEDNVLHTSYPPGHFGAVISLGVVEHFEQGPQAAFAEAYRVLRGGGLFFVTVPTQNFSRICIANSLKELKRWYRRRKGVRFVFEEYRYTRREFHRLLEQAGFSVIDVAYDDFLPPRSMGFHVDYPFFRHRQRRWELNAVGAFINGVFRFISPRTVAAGTLWVCRKPGTPLSSQSAP